MLKYNEENVKKQKEVQKVHDDKSNKQSSRKSSGSSKVQSRRSEGTRDRDKDKDKDKDSDSRASTPIALLERVPSRTSKSSGNAPTPTSSSDSPLEAPRKKRGYKLLNFLQHLTGKFRRIHHMKMLA